MLELVFGAVTYAVVFLSCYDGDTCTVIFSEKDAPISFMQEQKIRFESFDTPEIKGRRNCDEEEKLGLEAKQVTENYFTSAKRRLNIVDEDDPYGGFERLRVEAPELGELLISKGLALKYPVKNKKQAWCS